MKVEAVTVNRITKCVIENAERAISHAGWFEAWVLGTFIHSRKVVCFIHGYKKSAMKRWTFPTFFTGSLMLCDIFRVNKQISRSHRGHAECLDRTWGDTILLGYGFMVGSN